MIDVKKKSLIIVTLVMLFFTIKLTAQYEIEFNEIKGSLNLEDKYSKDLGRYDGFEIPLYKDETVNFIVQAENFIPKIIFVTPAGNVYKQSISSRSNFASLLTTVNESGDWILYIVGDSLAEGNYTLQYSFASQNSLKYKNDLDFCSSLDFILSHAKAYFLLLESVEVLNGSFVKLNGSIDSFIDEADGSYSAKMFESNSLSEAEKIYGEYSSRIAKCLGSSYQKKSQNWVEVEDYKMKSTLFTEKTTDKERLVLVTIKDLSKSKYKFTGNYVVQILVSRKS